MSTIAVLFLMLMACGAAYVFFDSFGNWKKEKGISLKAAMVENRALRNRLDTVEQIVRSHYDVSPLFADVVLEEFSLEKRRELEG